MIRFDFICIDCGQTAVTSSPQRKRCKSCRRIRHNQRQAAYMARKRTDPAFREAERGQGKARMRRLREARRAAHRGGIPQPRQNESISP